MSPGNLLEIIPADPLDTLEKHGRMESYKQQRSAINLLPSRSPEGEECDSPVVQYFDWCGSVAGWVWYHIGTICYRINSISTCLFSGICGEWAFVSPEHIIFAFSSIWTFEQFICMVVDGGIELSNPRRSADAQLWVLRGQRNVRLCAEARIHEVDFVWVQPGRTTFSWLDSDVDSPHHKRIYAAQETRRLGEKHSWPLCPGNYVSYDCVVHVGKLLSELKYCSSPILGYERWAWSWSRFLGSQPTGDISHKPGGRLLLLFTKPGVTFPTN